MNPESASALMNNNFIDYLKKENIVYILDKESYVKWLQKSESLNLVEIKDFGNLQPPYLPERSDNLILFKIEFN